MQETNSTVTNVLSQEYLNGITSCKINTDVKYNGVIGENDIYKLRLAMIDNPEINRDIESDNHITLNDPLNITGIFNMNNGYLTLRWLDSNGGQINDSDYNGVWEHVIQLQTEEPENRKFNEWNIASKRENVQLTHPFIWSTSENWCGFNYIPPVGAVVIVGFLKKGNTAVILGFLPQNYEATKPYLKPGEILLKGYGGNRIHFRQSDKLDIKTQSIEGKTDLESLTNSTNVNGCENLIRLDSNNDNITVSCTNTSTGEQSNIIITPYGIELNTDNLTINADNITLNGITKINGDTTISGTTNVNGNTIVNGNLTISNAINSASIDTRIIKTDTVQTNKCWTKQITGGNINCDTIISGVINANKVKTDDLDIIE